MKPVVLGETESGDQVRVDISALVATRLLIQASSGGGKSWTLRRLLEQSHGQIQHIVLDPEGEFGSLRERYPYVLAGKGGDIASDPKTAPLLAHRLLELRVSAVLDLYELRARDRTHFVKTFLESLINAPKALWHPVLVVIDEAHVYCPEKGDAESAEEVIGLCTRGRKRGFCAVLATQRLANLSKQAAAQCLNVMVGPTFLDVDRKRAVEILGVTGAEEKRLRSGLMQMRPGQFWAIGRAFTTPGLSQLTVGPVETHHPEIAGSSRAQLTPPPPPEKVRAVLAKLADLPREVEDERTREARLAGQVRELQAEVKRLEREAASERPAQQIGITEQQLADYLSRRDVAWEARLAAALTASIPYQKALKVVQSHCLSISRAVAELPSELPTIEPPAPWDVQERSRELARANPVPRPATAHVIPSGNVASAVDTGDYRPRAGARRMLAALASYPTGAMTAGQLRMYARLRKSGTSDTYLSELRRYGLIEEDGDALRITAKGMTLCEGSGASLSAAEVLARWRSILRAGCVRMLDAVVDARGRGMTREELGQAAGLEPSSGTFATYLGELRRAALIEESGGLLRASETLFMGAGR